MKSLPIIVQNIVYRKTNSGDYEVLLLKRTEQRGGFWNVVNGTLEINESIYECLRRELFEETGIKKTINQSGEINRFSFERENNIFMVLVYSSEIDSCQQVVINEEHTEYKWIPFKEAIKLMKFKEDKDGLKKCYKKLKYH